MQPIRHRNQKRGLRGSAILEFALVMSFLVPLFAGMFSVGISMAKGIQLSNVCEDALLLMVDSVTNPNSGLDLSKTQNQRIVIRAARGLGMNSDAQYDPSSTGSGAVILTKVVMVGPAECALGVVPAPPSAPPWNSSNCPNYGQYVFAYRVAFGNTSRWASTFGNPPVADVQPDGTVSAANIAKDTGDVATIPTTSNGAVITLTPSTFALVSETWADISNVNLFSIFKTPILYSRGVS